MSGVFGGCGKNGHDFISLCVGKMPKADKSCYKRTETNAMEERLIPAGISIIAEMP